MKENGGNTVVAENWVQIKRVKADQVETARVQTLPSQQEDPTPNFKNGQSSSKMTSHRSRD